MGHPKSISDETVKINTQWDYFEAGAAWAIEEVVAWLQRLDSPALAMGIGAGLALKAKGAGTIYKLGPSQMAKAGGQEADALRKAVLKLALAEAARQEADLETLSLPLPLTDDLTLVTRGAKGRGLQSEVAARALTPLPSIMQNTPQACFDDSEKAPQACFRGQKKAHEACFVVENAPEVHHLDISTPTHPSTTTHPPTFHQEGVQGEGGVVGSKVALEKKFLAKKVRPDAAHKAAKALSEAEAQKVLDQWDALCIWAEGSGGKVAAPVLAYRCGSGDIADGFAWLRGRNISPLRREDGKNTSTIASAPQALPATQKGLEALLALEEAIEELDGSKPCWLRDLGIELEGTTLACRRPWNSDWEPLLVGAADALGLAVRFRPSTQNVQKMAL